MWLVLSAGPALGICVGQTGVAPQTVAIADSPQSAKGTPAAGDAQQMAAHDGTEQDETLTMFQHSETAPWFVAGQTNIIFQAHPSFHSPYQGTNSFHGAGEYKTSLLGTLFLGYQLGRGVRGATPMWSQRYNTDFIADFESSGGRGLSQALGLAGFTNLDVVRNPNLGSKPYVARVQFHQTIGFTNEMTEVERGPFSLATEAPVRRVELRLGKMSLPDVLDINGVLSDSHMQFTNWTVDNNGAWDYAADTRGYTYAGVVEYQDRRWAARYVLAAMPTVANGIDLDWALSRAHGQYWEFELRRGWLPGRKGTQRVLAFVNNAHMGDYREAVQAYVDGVDATPDIHKHEHFGAVKYGFTYNVEQQVTDHLRAAGRFGWNEGQHESFAYTEVDQTVLLGADYDGAQWGRKNDKVGLALVSNAIKKDHQNYLADGGLGFILGDGHLKYGRETTEEAYYNTHAWRGLFFALGFSHVDNPGYNRDRGPVWVPSIRCHVEF